MEPIATNCASASPGKDKLKARDKDNKVAEVAVTDPEQAVAFWSDQIHPLAKRLREGKTIADDREFNRLYRYLVGQGFESDRVVTLLKSRNAPRHQR